MGLTTATRSSLGASGDFYARGDPKPGESELSGTCIFFTFGFKQGITASQWEVWNTETSSRGK